MITKKITQLLIILGCLTFTLSACTQTQHTPEYVSIGFYNLENLFDTLDTPNKRDEEYTPEGRKQWDSKRYQQKLTHMAKAIAELGSTETPEGPAIVGICEAENIEVLKDLVATAPLKASDYQPILIEGPDRRGIDVGLLYRPNAFTVTNKHSHRLAMPNDSAFRTRDQLVVSGKLYKEPFHIIVNHWPSRYGGEEKSRPNRIAAANLTRHIVDSLMALNDKGRIVIMGDFNDDPNNKSIEEHLKALPMPPKAAKKNLYNTTRTIFENGEGTLCYRGKWNLFDQMIISGNLLTKRPNGYKFHEVHIQNRPYLLQQEGKYQGYPNRTHAGGYYLGGYSDHLPVYLILKKQ